MSLVRLRPEVDEPNWLHAPRAYLVELAYALRLPFELAVELLEPDAPGAHIGFELALLLLLYALGGSEERRRRLRDATREVFGEASALTIGPVSPDA